MTYSIITELLRYERMCRRRKVTSLAEYVQTKRTRSQAVRDTTAKPVQKNNGNGRKALPEVYVRPAHTPNPITFLRPHLATKQEIEEAKEQAQSYRHSEEPYDRLFVSDVVPD